VSTDDIEHVIILILSITPCLLNRFLLDDLKGLEASIYMRSWMAIPFGVE